MLAVNFTKAVAEYWHQRFTIDARSHIEEPNHRHRRMLRARRAAKPPNVLAWRAA
jgi:hypothetical protein